MLKMFLPAVADGGDHEFWDETWASQGQLFVDNDRVCENQPMFPLLRDTLRPTRLFLEGGCGRAQWVKYFHDRGQRAVGIDFAPRTVAWVKSRAPELDVREGDVTALPLPTASVHAYYSGGVVEHFENGPEAALAEARRVLASDGFFLCSVPDHSWLRQLLYRGDETRLPGSSLVVRTVYDTEAGTAPSGTRFFQYAFTPDEFGARLESAGFRVERTFGYSLLWGLYEIPGLQRAEHALRQAVRTLRSRGAATAVTTSSGQGAAPVGRDGLWVQALVKEDRSLPVFGALVGAALERAANMRMYVARPA